MDMTDWVVVTVLAVVGGIGLGLGMLCTLITKAAAAGKRLRDEGPDPRKWQKP